MPLPLLSPLAQHTQVGVIILIWTDENGEAQKGSSTQSYTLVGGGAGPKLGLFASRCTGRCQGSFTDWTTSLTLKKLLCHGGFSQKIYPVQHRRRSMNLGVEWACAQVLALTLPTSCVTSLAIRTYPFMTTRNLSPFVQGGNTEISLSRTQSS